MLPPICGDIWAAIRAVIWPGIGAGGWPHICVGSRPAFGTGIGPVLGTGIPNVWGGGSWNADLDASMFCTGVSRRPVVLYLEEDTATLLVGHQVHPRNTLCDHYIAELLMFVGRPLRAEARQSCYESQSRTIH